MEVNNESADSMSPSDLQAMLVCSIHSNVLITRMRILNLAVLTC